MNPFLNPIFVCGTIKSYLVDVDRLRKTTSDKLKKFQDKALKKIVKYAYNVPLYREKYKKAGVHPSDIKKIEDLQKLPFITKNNLRENFPDKIVSSTFDKKRAVISYTSGTTGEPVSIYINIDTIIKGLLGYVRVLREHEVNWRKTKITLVVDLSENSAEREYLINGIIPCLKPFFSFKNIQIFNTYDNSRRIIKKINEFQPEFIGGYPGMLRQLAVLKEKGLGKQIQPKCIISSGAVLTEHLRKRIEETFETKVFDAYGAMETGPTVFQCRNRKYHIHSDLVHLEFVDDNGETVSPGEPGHVVATRLYGGGTPIIRYTGLDDIITPTDETCNCGLTSGLIKKIHGREDQSIVLPDGRILLPYSFSETIGEISQKIDINKIERFQMIQHKIDKVEILVKVDSKLRDTEPSLDKIMSVIEKSFKEKLGSNIDVKVREKKRFKPHTPGIISKVDKNRVTKKIYI